jgi:CO/xanthine dehydrogenase Mo-binding subunit
MLQEGMGMNELELKGTGATRYIGERVARKEDARLLTGQGQFTDDVRLPGMLHCAFVRSAVARVTCQASRRSIRRKICPPRQLR